MATDNNDRRHAALQYALANAEAGDPESVLAALDEFARTREFLMNVGPEKGPWLAEIVCSLPAPARVLELGCYCGYSAVLIASNLPTGGHLISVELDPESAAVAQQVIDHAGLAQRVDIIVGDSQDVIAGLSGTFDLVFLDHWKDVYERDLKALLAHGLLAPNAIVFADNVGPHFNPESYLEFVRTSGHFDTEYRKGHIEYTDREDGVEISVYRGRASGG